MFLFFFFLSPSNHLPPHFWFFNFESASLLHVYPKAPFKKQRIKCLWAVYLYGYPFCRILLFVINIAAMQFATLKRLIGIIASKCWLDFWIHVKYIGSDGTAQHRSIVSSHGWLNFPCVQKIFSGRLICL